MSFRGLQKKYFFYSKSGFQMTYSKIPIILKSILLAQLLVSRKKEHTTDKAGAKFPVQGNNDGTSNIRSSMRFM